MANCFAPSSWTDDDVHQAPSRLRAVPSVDFLRNSVSSLTCRIRCFCVSKIRRFRSLWYLRVFAWRRSCVMIRSSWIITRSYMASEIFWPAFAMDFTMHLLQSILIGLLPAILLRSGIWLAPACDAVAWCDRWWGWNSTTSRTAFAAVSKCCWPLVGSWDGSGSTSIADSVSFLTPSELDTLLIQRSSICSTDRTCRLPVGSARKINTSRTLCDTCETSALKIIFKYL